jgi:LmbE family N-acetylglucosaminyl deacetylase
MKILALGAHLDDIELGCGGALARASKAGHECRMICMSDSAYANYDGKVLRTRDQGLREGQAAAEALGCEALEILDFPTKDIPDGSRTVEAIDERIQEFQPDVIFTHWPFDTHQAHRGTGLATMAAARRENTILMYDPVFPAGRSFVGFRPQVYIDITDVIEQKLESLAATSRSISSTATNGSARSGRARSSAVTRWAVSSERPSRSCAWN